MSSRNERLLRASARAACLLALLLAPGAAMGQHRGRSVPSSSTDPATAPTATGMMYGGFTLELGPDGQFRSADYPTVTRVDSGSISARAGFQVGDVLLSVNGK